MAVVISVTPAFAQESIDVRDVVALVISSDPAMRVALLKADIAAADYRSTILRTRPNITLDVAPYAFTRVRVPGASGTTADTRTHSASLGLSVVQGLPTSGVLSGTIENTISRSTGNGDAIEQMPSVSAALSQPLFAGSSVIDTDLFRATRRAAELGVEGSNEEARAQRNRSIRTALGLFVDVASLRRSRDSLRTTLDVLQRQIDDARISLEQGSISDTTLLALRVNVNSRRNALLQTELALVQAEQELARVIGASNDEGLVIDDAFPAFGSGLSISTEEIAENNSAVRAGRFAVERARLNDLLNDGLDRPTVSVSVTATPAYPDSRANADDLGSSLSDLFASGATVESTVALGLSVPLLTRAERNTRESADEARIEEALVRLGDTERAVDNQVRILLLNREILAERLEAVAVDLQYQRDRLASERALLSAQASTQLRVDEVALDLAARENEAWQIRAELFLNALDLLAAAGDDVADVLLR